ncbi:MAG TPA: porin [Thermoanaerobaculia bacterium]|nr:porin [Thermoanaerobaculia bacterium]
MRKASKWTAGLCALVLALMAAPAAAQIMGLYYQEVEKDGRIYVFNTPERYKAFEESGEIGTAITLPGIGVDGKTVVAENETAIDLYLFRHNLPGYERPTPKPATPGYTVGWKDGKTTIGFKNGQLVLSNRVQLRFTEQMPEVGDDKGSFRVRRAKTKFEGWAYTKDLTYELQLNWPDSSNPLEDANVNYDFTHGKKSFMLKAGQFKVPFGRQELTSSGSQQFVDRSAVSNTFARGRDIGLQAWGTPLGGKIDWRVGLFNGNGRTVSSNDNDKYQYNARLTFQPFGDVKYSESDFESSDRPLLAIAANYESNDRSGATTNVDVDREILGYDVAFKLKGFSLFAELFDATDDPETGVDRDLQGFHAQAGYFIVPQKFEIAVRLAELDPNSDIDNNEQEERGVAFNYFLNKHAHKLQLDYRQLENKATDREDDEVRLQYQIIF